MKQHLIESKDVQNAKKNGQPILALESTIITHGLPWPQNFEFAQEVEQIAKDHGVTPATIGVINGSIRIGMEHGDLEFFAKEGPKVLKLSKFDIPYAIAQKKAGSTTVAGTMACAALAGIEVFATGGIGGVHRDFQHTLDISHDLETLSKERMIVISAGAKAILDLPATLEYLETKGVLVAGYKTNDFPAFYYATSDLQLSYRFDTPEEIVKTFQSGMQSSLLVANPIPPQDALPKAHIEQSIKNALDLCLQKKIKGKAVTPFLLAEMEKITKGQSLKANLSLVRNNVRLGCHIANALKNLKEHLFKV